MLSEDIQNALLNTRINHYLNQKEIDLLLNHADVKIFSDGEVIINQGKKSAGIFIIVEGVITVCSKLLGEGDVCIARLHCGNYFGEISIIAKQPCIASFIADGVVKCIFIKEIYFNHLNLFFPKIKYQISRAICDDMNSRYQLLYNNLIQTIERNKIKKQNLLTEVTQSLIKPIQVEIENTNCKFDQIKQSKIFDPFTEKELTILLQPWVCLEASKNCTLIHEREINAGCFFILQGAVQVNIIHNNKLAKISVLGPLKLFSPLSVIDPSAPSLINYTTCEHAILLYMPEKNFAHLQENHLTVWYKFFDLICAEMACLERSTNELDLRLRTEFYNR